MAVRTHQQQPALPANLKSVLALVNMTEEEYLRVMNVNESWPHPAVEDGWVKVHDALRHDMMDMHQALDFIIDRLEAGEPVQPWIIANLQKWWPIFEDHVHHHHDNEELIVFPVLSKRVQLPPKMTADHVTLLKELADIAAIIKGLKPGLPACNDYVTFTELRERFRSMRQEMCEHLLEEEIIGLPLLRKHMTHKQFVPLEKKLQAGMALADLGWFLRAFPNDEARKEWMTHVARIPGLVQKFLFLPATAKYDRNVTRLLLEVRLNRQIRKKAPQRAMLCLGGDN